MLPAPDEVLPPALVVPPDAGFFAAVLRFAAVVRFAAVLREREAGFAAELLDAAAGFAAVLRDAPARDAVLREDVDFAAVDFAAVLREDVDFAAVLREREAGLAALLDAVRLDDAAGFAARCASATWTSTPCCEQTSCARRWTGAPRASRRSWTGSPRARRRASRALRRRSGGP